MAKKTRLERPRDFEEEFKVESAMQKKYGTSYKNPEDVSPEDTWFENLKKNVKAMTQAKKSMETGGKEGRLDIPFQVEQLGGRKRRSR